MSDRSNFALAADEPHWHQLEASLRARFDVVSVSVPFGEHSYELLRPRSADDLISEEDFDVDGRLPYWPEVWPSARVLADRIAGVSCHGKRLLELGCGLGFASLIAAQKGFEVLATDYYAEALEFLCLNAARQGLRVPNTRVVDWREFPADLGTFDVILAADVLYEKPMCGLIADAIRRSLNPQGEAFVSDPCRLLAAGFPDVCSDRGLSVDRIENVPYEDAETKQTIRVYEVRHAPRSS